jgi:hypothetical protein
MITLPEYSTSNIILRLSAPFDLMKEVMALFTSLYGATVTFQRKYCFISILNDTSLKHSDMKCFCFIQDLFDDVTILLLILIRSINMQLYLFSFLFLHYMFRLHAAIFRWFSPLYSLLHGSCCFCNANFSFLIRT